MFLHQVKTLSMIKDKQIYYNNKVLSNKRNNQEKQAFFSIVQLHEQSRIRITCITTWFSKIY